MSIGSVIKKLRRENDMTQEQLADILGLTAAAVSGWECDRNAPDISQIPQLAHIFGVSADTLLEIDLTDREEKIEKIILRATEGTREEAIKTYRLGLAEFPSSYRLMVNLADMLNVCGDEAGTCESIALYERVREGTKDPYLKNLAEGRLCGIYVSKGRRDEALRLAENVPHFSYSHDDFERMVAQGVEKIYNVHYKVQCEFASLCDNIFLLTNHEVDGREYFTHEQSVTMLEKIPRLFEVFYENGDYNAEGFIVAWAWIRMAEHFADMGDSENALRCAGAAVKAAKKVDEYYAGLGNGFYAMNDVHEGIGLLPKEKRHTSILASPEFDWPTTTSCVAMDEESTTERIKCRLSHERFDFVRDEIGKMI